LQPKKTIPSATEGEDSTANPDVENSHLKVPVVALSAYSPLVAPKKTSPSADVGEEVIEPYGYGE
jgi:hypothetical protein